MFKKGKYYRAKIDIWNPMTGKLFTPGTIKSAEEWGNVLIFDVSEGDFEHIFKEVPKPKKNAISKSKIKKTAIKT